MLHDVHEVDLLFEERVPTLAGLGGLAAGHGGRGRRHARLMQPGGEQAAEAGEAGPGGGNRKDDGGGDGYPRVALGVSVLVFLACLLAGSTRRRTNRPHVPGAGFPAVVRRLTAAGWLAGRIRAGAGPHGRPGRGFIAEHTPSMTPRSLRPGWLVVYLMTAAVLTGFRVYPEA